MSDIAEALSAALGAPVAILAMAPLPGGAVRRHLRIDASVDGKPQSFVLRQNGLTPLGIGLELGREFELLQRLASTGLAVAPPVAAIGEGHVTRFVDGIADPHAIVAAGPHPALAQELGRELARLQRVAPPAFLGAAVETVVAARIEDAMRRLDAMGEGRPAAEWAMRWLLRNAPSPLPAVLCHGDFRTGNYLVDGSRPMALRAILDWEFACSGDPDEDLGWFCSRCWRFGADDRAAGGIADRAALFAGYESLSGRAPDPARVRFWEAMAALKWLVVALLQRDRCLRRGERSLDLALTGRRAAECEYELLRLVSGRPAPATRESAV